MINLIIGNPYNKSDLAEVFSEKNIVKCREGLYYSKVNGTILFVTLDKTKKEKKYNDYFDSEVKDLFHWDSQDGQTYETPKIQEIVKGIVDVHLFARIKQHTKSKTNPFIYCGQVQYLDYDPTSSKPVHITFQLEKFIDNPNQELDEIYKWKPTGAQKTSVKPLTANIKEKARIKRQISGQGFIKDPEDKKAVELWAMKIAREHYENLGYVVKDISANRGEAIDFECIKDGDVRFVEVKGTQGLGDEVMLYYTEIDKALSGNFHIDLFVVHSILITKNDGVSVASDGVKEIYRDWSPDPDRLKVVTYKYRLKP